MGGGACTRAAGLAVSSRGGAAIGSLYVNPLSGTPDLQGRLPPLEGTMQQAPSMGGGLQPVAQAGNMQQQWLHNGYIPQVDASQGVQQDPMSYGQAQMQAQIAVGAHYDGFAQSSLPCQLGSLGSHPDVQPLTSGMQQDGSAALATPFWDPSVGCQQMAGCAPSSQALSMGGPGCGGPLATPFSGPLATHFDGPLATPFGGQ